MISPLSQGAEGRVSPGLSRRVLASVGSALPEPGRSQPDSHRTVLREAQGGAGTESEDGRAGDHRGSTLAYLLKPVQGYLSESEELLEVGLWASKSTGVLNWI